MARPSRVTVLAEDRRQQQLIFRYLRRIGLETHAMRLLLHPQEVESSGFVNSFRKSWRRIGAGAPALKRSSSLSPMRTHYRLRSDMRSSIEGSATMGLA